MDAGRNEEKNVTIHRLAHGGDMGEFKRTFPHAPTPFVDLSTGINPVPYPLPDVPHDCHTRLPQAVDIAALEHAAATAYGAKAEGVVAAPGTQALIQWLPRLFASSQAARSHVAILGPTYEEHAHAWSLAGHHVKTVTEISALRDADVAILVNPNNPTGRCLPPHEIAALIDGPNRLRLIVVDEAFGDFLQPDQSCINLTQTRPVIVLRSFGKTYGLAGLRLGFSISNAERAQRLRQALGPWSVAGLTIAAGRAALSDRPWKEQTRERLRQDCERLDDLLRRAGFHIEGGTLLFRLAAHGDAQVVFNGLGQAGISVRRFADRSDWLRFGLPGEPLQWTRLASALGLS